MASKIVWSICSAGCEMARIPRICRAEIATTIMISAYRTVPIVFGRELAMPSPAGCALGGGGVAPSVWADGLPGMLLAVDPAFENHFSNGTAPSAVSTSWRTTLARSAPTTKTTMAPMRFGRKPSTPSSSDWIGASAALRPRSWSRATRPNIQASRDPIEPRVDPMLAPSAPDFCRAGTLVASLVKTDLMTMAMIHVTTRMATAARTVPSRDPQSVSSRKSMIELLCDVGLNTATVYAAKPRMSNHRPADCASPVP